MDIKQACREGNLQRVNDLIQTCKTLKHSIDWDMGLACACTGRSLEHLQIVKLMMSNGANDWNWALRCACSSPFCNRDIIELLILKGANNFNLSLQSACFYGNTEAAQMMISKGANDWNLCLAHACYKAHPEIINLLITKGANNISECFEILCDYTNSADSDDSENRHEIAKLLLSKGADTSRAWSAAVRNKCYRVQVLLLLLNVNGVITRYNLTGVNFGLLVQEYGLPMRKLKYLHQTEYASIKHKYNQVQSFVTSVILTDLTCLIIRYLIV